MVNGKSFCFVGLRPPPPHSFFWGGDRSVLRTRVLFTTKVLIIFDVKLCGEPDSNPQTRIAPLRDCIYQSLVAGVTEVRDGVMKSNEFPEGDLVLLLDGGRYGNKTSLIKPWKTSVDGSQRKLEESQVFVFYDEESLRNSRGLTRGTNSLRRVEHMHVLTHAKLTLPEVPYEVLPGTNKGDAMGPITVDKWQDEWFLTPEEKKAVYSKKHRVEVGGQGPAMDTTPELTNIYQGQVPVFYHPMPHDFYASLLKAYFVKGCIDLAAGAGKLAHACLRAGVPYVGVCMSAEHARALRARLCVRLLMSDRQSTITNV